MVERTAVNRDVVGSSPTRGVFLNIRLRGQAVKTSPFHGGNTGSIPVGVTRKVCRCGSILDNWGGTSQLQAEQLVTNQLESHMPMWLNWQSSWFVISRLSVRVRSSALYNLILNCIMGRFPSGQRGQTVNLLQIASVVRIHLCPFFFLEDNIYRGMEQSGSSSGS